MMAVNSEAEEVQKQSGQPERAVPSSQQKGSRLVELEQNPGQDISPPFTTSDAAIDGQDATATRQGAEVDSPIHSPEVSPDGLATLVTPLKKDSSYTSISITETHKITVGTISSTPPPSSSDYSRGGQHNHNQTAEPSNGGFLHDIIEDVQFCGMALCGEFLGIIDSTPAEVDGKLVENVEASSMKKHIENTTAEVATVSKEERVKEMDDTFLGKMISCVNIDESCGVSDDHAVWENCGVEGENFFR